jgi:hypothetical protein
MPALTTYLSLKKSSIKINKGKSNPAASKFNQGSIKCQVCGKSVYPMEKLEYDGQSFHKACLKCETCKRNITPTNCANLHGKYYCKPHLKQLFQLKGNYDEGFGQEQRKKDWNNKEGSTPPAKVTPAKQPSPPPVEAPPPAEEPATNEDNAPAADATEATEENGETAAAEE